MMCSMAMHYPHHHWLQNFDNGRAVRKLQQWGSVPRQPRWLRTPWAEASGVSNHLTVIVEQLLHKSWRVRSSAASTIGCSARRAAQFVYNLCDLLKDPDILVRGSAAAAVGRCFHPTLSIITAEQVVHKLQRLLDDEHWLPRQAAVCAIGQIIGGGADCLGDLSLRYSVGIVSAVAIMLADADARVREAAAYSLKQMGILGDAGLASGMKLGLAQAAAKEMEMWCGDADGGFQLLQSFGWRVGKIVTLAARQWAFGNDRPQVLKSTTLPSVWGRLRQGIGVDASAGHMRRGGLGLRSKEKIAGTDNLEGQKLALNDIANAVKRVNESDTEKHVAASRREMVLEQVLETYVADFGLHHTDTTRVRENLQKIHAARAALHVLPGNARDSARHSARLRQRQLAEAEIGNGGTERGTDTKHNVGIRWWQTSESAGVSKHHRRISAEVFIRMRVEVSHALQVIFHWISIAGIDTDAAQARALYCEQLGALLRDASIPKEEENITTVRASQIRRCKRLMFRELQNLGHLTIGDVKDNGGTTEPLLDYRAISQALGSMPALPQLLLPSPALAAHFDSNETSDAQRLRLDRVGHRSGNLTTLELSAFLDRTSIRQIESSGVVSTSDGLEVALIPRPAGLRAGCAVALGAFGSEHQAGILVTLLDDEQEEVRKRAAMALRSLRLSMLSKPVLTRLVTMFKSSSWRARVSMDWEIPAAVISILGGISSEHGEITYLPMLLRMLGASQSKEGSLQYVERRWELRAATLDALGAAGASIAANEHVAIALERSLSDTNWHVRRAAVLAVSQIGFRQDFACSSDGIIEELARLANRDEQLRPLCKTTLRQLGAVDPWGCASNLAETLIEIVVEEQTRSVAAALLRQMNQAALQLGAGAIAAGRLGTDDLDGRRAGLSALERMGSKAVPHTEALIAAIGDGDESIALGALGILDMIGVKTLSVPLKRSGLGRSKETSVNLSRLRDRAFEKLAAHENSGEFDELASAVVAGDSGALWIEQMRQQAVAGNLDIHELCDVESLPTLLKLLDIPSLRHAVHDCIAKIAVAGDTTAPSIPWPTLLHPLLCALEEPASFALQNCLSMVLDWADRCDGTGGLATEGHLLYTVRSVLRDSTHWRVRLRAVEMLRSIGSVNAQQFHGATASRCIWRWSEVIAEALSDRIEAVRRAATSALGTIGGRIEDHWETIIGRIAPNDCHLFDNKLLYWAYASKTTDLGVWCQLLGAMAKSVDNSAEHRILAKVEAMFAKSDPAGDRILSHSNAKSFFVALQFDKDLANDLHLSYMGSIGARSAIAFGQLAASFAGGRSLALADCIASFTPSSISVQNTAAQAAAVALTRVLSLEPPETIRGVVCDSLKATEAGAASSALIEALHYVGSSGHGEEGSLAIAEVVVDLSHRGDKSCISTRAVAAAGLLLNAVRWEARMAGAKVLGASGQGVGAEAWLDTLATMSLGARERIFVRGTPPSTQLDGEYRQVGGESAAGRGILLRHVGAGADGARLRFNASDPPLQRWQLERGDGMLLGWAIAWTRSRNKYRSNARGVPESLRRQPAWALPLGTTEWRFDEEGCVFVDIQTVQGSETSAAVAAAAESAVRAIREACVMHSGGASVADEHTPGLVTSTKSQHPCAIEPKSSGDTAEEMHLQDDTGRTVDSVLATFSEEDESDEASLTLRQAIAAAQAAWTEAQDPLHVQL